MVIDTQLQLFAMSGGPMQAFCWLEWGTFFLLKAFFYLIVSGPKNLGADLHLAEPSRLGHQIMLFR
jgi:hypothetical protein